MSNAFASISFAGVAGLLGVAELTTPGSDYVTTLLASVGSAAAGITGLIIAINALLKRLGTMNADATGLTPRPTQLPPMGVALYKPVLLAVLASLTVFGGVACNASATTKILALREAYTATLETAAYARQQGLIDDADYAEIERRRIIAAGLLNSVESSLHTRLPPTPGQIVAAAEAVAAFGEAVNP
jgi:hypothetical protein